MFVKAILSLDKKNHLKRNLSRLIARKGFTFRHISELTGVPKSTIHRYATDENVKAYDLDALIAIADLFGVTLDDLIY